VQFILAKWQPSGQQRLIYYASYWLSFLRAPRFCHLFFSLFFSIFSPLPKLPGHCSMADKRKIKGKQNENGWGGLGKMGEKKSLLISSLKNC